MKKMLRENWKWWGKKERKRTFNCLEYSSRALWLDSQSLSRNRNRLNPKWRSQAERQPKESVATAERESWTTTWKGLRWSSSQSEQERAKCDAIGTAIAKAENRKQDSVAVKGFEWSIMQIHFRNDSNLRNSAESDSDSDSDFRELIWDGDGDGDGDEDGDGDFFSGSSMAWEEQGREKNIYVFFFFFLIIINHNIIL